MDKEQLQKSILKTNMDAQTMGTANRIIQSLQKLRYSNNENSAKRWIWELCQNAKDVCNSTGKVKISICFDENNKKLLFKHNGRAFTMNNLIFLINQVSSKDRNDEQRKSGKFGTGFLTTHLLSEIVNLSGVLIDDNGEYSRFHITLDRTGHEKEEIAASIQKSIEQLQECQPLILGERININNYNTVFEYELDDDGVEVAREGLKNLRVSAPFVLSMLHDIEEIQLETSGDVFRYSQEYSCGLKNAKVHEIYTKINGKEENVCILNLSEENTAVLIALEVYNDKIFIKKYDESQSKLFCDFPLIGTEDFPFPVIVSSSCFNPTEPRDGLFLTCKSKIKIDKEIEENREILNRACGLYKRLLEYSVEKAWQGNFNITKFDSYKIKEWYDEKWIEDNIENTCKEIILHTPIISNCGDTKKAILDDWDNEQIYIISDADEIIREKIWNLGSVLCPEQISCKEDVNNWYHSLWQSRRNFTFRTLTKKIEKYENIKALSDVLHTELWNQWLDSYYSMVVDKKDVLNDILSGQIAIIPNQNGNFCTLSSLYYDNNILPEYKEILKILGNDCGEWLLNRSVNRKEWFGCKEYSNNDFLIAIENGMKNATKDQERDIYFRLICLSSAESENYGKQKKITEYASMILCEQCEIKMVSTISENLLEAALKYTVTKVADDISECQNIDGLAFRLGIDANGALAWLAGFIEFVVKNGYDNLIGKSTRPILPNQNGIFKSKDDLFLDNEIDDTLKKLSVDAAEDIRNELLAREVYLELPSNRVKRDSDLVQTITQYVKQNRLSASEDVRNYFRTLLIWMNDHDEKSKTLFSDLYEKKYYLYDDKEIAENMKKAEAFDTILQDYNISSPSELEKLIKKVQLLSSDNAAITNEDVIENGKVDLTQDVLVQLGIDSEEALDQAFDNPLFAAHFIRKSKHNADSFEYVKRILERSKNNIIEYLKKYEGYDLSNIQKISNTIFVIEKEGNEIYLLTRPSDGGEVRIYYETEKDILDYSMDWELWVEDGKDTPEKITFGKIIKLTGINRIPLRSLVKKWS